MSSILIKIFSGAHRGADLELPEGVYVVGADDSCDIILCDPSLSARHATFRIQAENGSPVCLVEPLDGTLTLDEQQFAQETSVPARQPFFLSQVCMAWCLPNELEFAWKEVEERLSHHYSPKASPTDGAVPAPATEKKNISDAPEEQLLPPPAHGFPWKRCTAFLLALALAGGLTFSLQEKRMEKPPMETMQELLRQSGYTKLTVTGDDKSVTVRGRIASDSERGRLLRLSRLMSFPVYLDVQVGSDAARAVRASFNSLGLHPDVRELPPSEHPGLLVQGYVKDAVLEEQALSMARKDVPELQEKNGKAASLSVFRNIRHAEDIDVLIKPALSAAGLDHLAVTYLPGKVALHGALTPQSREALEDILTNVREKLGVPFPADIFNDAAMAAAASATSEQASGPRPAESSAASSTGFKVTSVATHGLRFITLENGERVFEGGELPGGFTIDRIADDALTLRKNQKTLNYPLRGTP